MTSTICVIAVINSGFFSTPTTSPLFLLQVRCSDGFSFFIQTKRLGAQSAKQFATISIPINCERNVIPAWKRMPPPTSMAIWIEILLRCEWELKGFENIWFAEFRKEIWTFCQRSWPAGSLGKGKIMTLCPKNESTTNRRGKFLVFGITFCWPFRNFASNWLIDIIRVGFAKGWVYSISGSFRLSKLILSFNDMWISNRPEVRKFFNLWLSPMKRLSEDYWEISSVKFSKWIGMLIGASKQRSRENRICYFIVFKRYTSVSYHPFNLEEGEPKVHYPSGSLNVVPKATLMVNRIWTLRPPLRRHPLKHWNRSVNL